MDTHNLENTAVAILDAEPAVADAVTRLGAAGYDYEVLAGGEGRTPLGERYLGIPEDLPGGSNGVMDVLDFGPFPGNTEELGVMLFTNGDRGAGNRGGATQDTEAMLFLVK